MKKTEDEKFVPDFGSRYFVEDFPFGLAILKGFCLACGVDTPFMDTVLGWFDGLFGTDYYKDGSFSGEGILNIPIPQNYGLQSVSDIERFYHSIE